MKLFVYHWHVADEADENDSMATKIRAYGIDENNHTVCLHIRGFQPWFYTEIRSALPWTEYRNLVKNKILDRYKGPIIKPFSLSYKQRLYFHHEERKLPFLKLSFPSIQSRRNAYYKLQKYTTYVLGKKTDIFCHEQEASPLLQLCCKQNLPTAGWMEFHGKKQPPHLKITPLEHEYVAEYQNLSGVSDDTMSVPTPTIFSFDIEVYSTNPKRMPDATVDGDCIFQISCVVETRDKVEKHLLTLGRVKPWTKSVQVHVYASEKELLLGFQALLTTKSPHVVIGYNIFGFDLPYMVERAKKYGIMDQFDIWGIPHKKHCPVKEIKWSSSAYSYQEFHYLDAEGRVFVDLLPVVKREYKFSTYKLKTVATFFLGETKDPLTHHDIFDAYRLGVLGDDTTKLSECAKYCVQDSYLVLRLFRVLETWIGLVEMAKICNVPIMSLFTQGQQIKVFSQVYRKCMEEGILVQSYASLPPTKELEDVDTYAGAYVFPPKPGVYDWVIPFDFSSLYPTTIIAYNIDYSTLVVDNSLPDSACHIIEWEDHIGCEHDPDKAKKDRTVCKHYRFRFRKSPMGVIPSLLQALLSQRSETKKRIKTLQNDPTLKTVLDKRQLAYKVSANSMYGAMGVKKGYLPFMPGAMSTTAMGRMSIQKAAEYVKKKHQGHLIYGDSVAPDTPLCLRYQGSIHMESIEDFFGRFETWGYPQFRAGEESMRYKEQSLPGDGYEILGGKGWTPVQRVIRHETVKTMYRVCTSSGLVEVTEDHSLVLASGELIKPSALTTDHVLLCIPLSESMRIHQELSVPMEDLKHLQITPDGFLRMRAGSSPVQWSRLAWFVHGNWPDFRWVRRKGEICIDCYNREGVERGKVLSVEKTASNEWKTVYDVETVEGRFHCGIGELVVKNTDSIYCHFETKQDSETIWKLAKSVENEFIRLFPKPMKLVFEEKIYQKFLILTKKRYMAYTCNQDGTLDKDLTIRGVLLARRDNCRWIREVYENVVRSIMEGAPEKEILDFVNTAVLDLFQWRVQGTADFVVSKLVGKDYKVKALPVDPKKLEKRCKDLHLTHVPSTLSPESLEKINKKLSEDPLGVVEPWLIQYVEKSQPAHAQLAMRLRRRGHPVEAGTRIEYLVLDKEDLKAKLNEKIEDPLYYETHCDLLRLDRLYYILSLSKPLDQILEVVFRRREFTKKLHNVHTTHKKMMQELEDQHRPLIQLEGEDPPKVKAKPKAKSKTKAKPKPKVTVQDLYDLL
uniref:DNA-directed DNA polymerase n=1 Tax=viral metagenome TaxID=1070528 RepID=A0A6C0IEE3_9ZZZZ